MAIAGLTIVGRPFATWPATLQMTPEGLLDSGLTRFFTGVRVSNTSSQAWPATQTKGMATASSVIRLGRNRTPVSSEM